MLSAQMLPEAGPARLLAVRGVLVFERLFGDQVWKGLCIGCCEVIKKVGVKRFAELVRTKMGDQVELGDYRFKSAQDIENILLEDN